MKDIDAKQLELGAAEASRQLARRVKSGQLSQDAADRIRSRITPQLDYQGIESADGYV